jgi:hypothetical protein
MAFLKNEIKFTCYLDQNIHDENNFKSCFHEFCENYTCLTELKLILYLSHKRRIIAMLEIFWKHCL